MKDENRSCGSCTVCCEGWLVINTDLIKAYPGMPCKDVISGKGCGIYETRPNEPCRNFFCSWVRKSHLFPDWMQPNQSKAIVMHEKLPWNNRKLDLVVPVGQSIPAPTLQWLNAYAKSNNKPFVYAEHQIEDGKLTGNRDIRVFAPQPLRGRILDWLEAGNTFW